MGPCIFAVLAVVPDDALSVLTSTLIDELVLDKLYQIRNDFIDDQQKRQIMAVTTILDGALNNHSGPKAWGPNWQITVTAFSTFGIGEETGTGRLHHSIMLARVLRVQNVIE